ncbi:MAG: ATP-binding cassette domain-containing protein [Firmicutes bacterium]|nr:ATP-binding cassette domain-containing protein [Bacillota bacterium]
MSTLVEVKNLKKYFTTPRGLLHAVDDISFSIEEGKTLGVVGESGCGKSTLGRTVIHLLEPTDGQIFFEGEDISKPSKQKLRELRKKMQFIFQDPYSSLNARMNTMEIIMEPLLINGMKKDKAQEAARNIMDVVGVARRLEGVYPHELDGGRRQRIGIARSLVLNPKFIICDEPVSALDVSIQAQILNLMQDLQEQMNLTYIFITHDLSVVKYISDNILVMYLGNMVEFANTKELFRNPLHPYTKALLSAVPTVDIDAPRKRILLEGEIFSPINPKPGCRFASRCRFASEKCRSEQPAAKDVGGGHFVACHNLENVK